MKLYLEDGEAIPAVKYLKDSDPAPSGFTLTVNPVDWDKHIGITEVSYKTYRNEMISQFVGSWSGYTSAKKKALVKNFIYPSATSEAALNALFPAATRKKQRRRVYKMIDDSPLQSVHKSITSSSVKHFAVQVDDSGTVSAVEIKSDVTF